MRPSGPPLARRGPSAGPRGWTEHCTLARHLEEPYDHDLNSALTQKSPWGCDSACGVSGGHCHDLPAQDSGDGLGPGGVVSRPVSLEPGVDTGPPGLPQGAWRGPGVMTDDGLVVQMGPMTASRAGSGCAGRGCGPRSG